jgi:hypothetical protein
MGVVPAIALLCWSSPSEACSLDQSSGVTCSHTVHEQRMRLRSGDGRPNGHRLPTIVPLAVEQALLLKAYYAASVYRFLCFYEAPPRFRGEAYGLVLQRGLSLRFVNKATLGAPVIDKCLATARCCDPQSPAIHSHAIAVYFFGLYNRSEGLLAPATGQKEDRSTVGA